MAKQNVNFVQRHLEKLIVGVTGLALLATIVLYAIQTPNTVRVGADSLGPSSFYQQIEQQTNSARERMRTARPDGPLLDLLPDSIMVGQLERPEAMVTAWIPPTPDLAAISSIDGPVETIRLAEILPPSPPALTTGRGRAALPEPAQLVLERTGFSVGAVGIGDDMVARPLPGIHGRATADLPIRDCYWVTVTTALFNREQIELFKNADYHDDRRDFAVAGFEVARQELLPDGQWGPTTIVTPYRPRNAIPDNIPLRRLENGSYVVDQASQALLESYRTAIQTGSDDNETLRPPLAEFLTDPYKTEWGLPDSLPGVNVDLSLYVRDPQSVLRSYEVSLEDPRGGRTGRRADQPRDAVRGPGTGEGSDRARRRLLVQKLEEATRALEEKRFLEAERLLDEIDQDGLAEDPQVKEARLLRIRYENEINAARAAEQRPTTQIQDAPIEPAWVNDTTVLPGRTYRYRLRILALNNYFGYPIPLADPADATKLLLASAWSEWSAPITVRDDTYLIFDRLVGQPPQASVEIYHWANGIWSSGRTEVGIGHRIALTGGFNFEYDGVILDIQPERPFMQRIESSRDNTISIRPRTSSAITVVNARGEVREHIDIEDRIVKRTIMDEERAVIDAARTRGFTPTQSPRERGRGGFRDDEGRGIRDERIAW